MIEGRVDFDLLDFDFDFLILFSFFDDDLHAQFGVNDSNRRNCINDYCFEL